MTEAEWEACTDPARMLEFLQSIGQASTRRLRLFGVACCRRIWALLSDERNRKAVKVTEQYIDGLVLEQELVRAAEAAQASGNVRIGFVDSVGRTQKYWMSYTIIYAATAASLTALAHPNASAAAANAVATHRALNAPGRGSAELVRTASAEERAAQCLLLRDIIGNPIHLLTISPAWLTWNDAIVVRLAEAAYDNRILAAGTLDNARLAVLADALEEAGCGDELILGHLRGGGEHYCGCFVVDALLGKS